MSSNIYSIDSIGSQGVSLKSHILAKTINLMILANIIACSLYQDYDNDRRPIFKNDD